VFALDPSQFQKVGKAWHENRNLKMKKKSDLNQKKSDLNRKKSIFLFF